jgi:hypothetical protein
MFQSLFRRLGLVLAASSCCALVIASVGADEAWAGDCTTANKNFELGLTNSCTSDTSLSTTASGYGVSVSDSTPSSVAISGFVSATTLGGVGVQGKVSSPFGNGVQGTLDNANPSGFAAGVSGTSNSTGQYGPGVLGFHSAATGSSAGVLGETVSGAANAVGVEGFALSDGKAGYFHVNGAGQGVWAQSGNGGTGVFGLTGPGASLGYGVAGSSQSTAADAAGVYGSINSNAANAAGVRGFNSHANCCGMGVAGFHAGQGIGVYGESPNGFAISGFSPNNWSGYFQGSVRVVGTLFKTAGAFQIEHPLDPAHKYLQHSFVESPDMKNVYDGNVTTDAKGFAVVKLPAYFQALNRDFRYQLTSLSGLQEVAVAKKISHNRFTIQSQKPHSEISWQVTGIRHDPYANAHRIRVVVPKQRAADGRYVHPELYGKPLSKSVVVLPGMDPRTRPKFQTLARRSSEND